MESSAPNPQPVAQPPVASMPTPASPPPPPPPPVMREKRASFVMPTLLLILGLALGGGGGYFIGFLQGNIQGLAEAESFMTSIQTTEDPTSETSTVENPLDTVDSNPLEDVQTNPFE